MRMSDSLAGLICALLGGWLLWHIQGFPELPGHFFGPGLFPSVIACGFVAGGVLLLLRAARAGGILVRLVQFPDWSGVGRYEMTGAALMFIAIVLFITTGESVGFPVLTFGTLLALYIWAQRSLLEILLLPPLLTLMFDLLFSRLLRVPLPSGWLSGFWLW